MFKTRHIKRFSLIKLFTHVSAVIILLMYNSLKDIPYLITLTLVMAFADYFRQFFLVAYNKPIKYIWVSTAVELFFIICVGFIDKTGINTLFFFTCISEAVIYYESRYSAFFLIIPFLFSRYMTNAFHNNYKNVTDVLVDIILISGVPIVFVTGMSYYVKAQIKEKEKFERTNTELEEAYKSLIEAQAVSQQLSIEKERTRMAREIHDTLAHTFTNLIVQLEVCKKLSSVDVGRLTEELEKAQELTRSGLNDVKRTIKSLRPQALEGKPFIESVLDFINNTMNNTEVHIILNNTLPCGLKLSTTLEITIFRLIQECITNSIRHGHSKEIQITMNLISDVISINIHDNGTGCSRIKKGYGLTGIQERVEAAGGLVDFSSTFGNGFDTKVSIPVKES